MAYEGEFRPGMVFEYVGDACSGEQRKLKQRMSGAAGLWTCESGHVTDEGYLRKHARLVSAPPVEEATPAARPLAEGWGRLDYDRQCSHCHAASSPVYVLETDENAWCYVDISCESCAERAGVFADVAVAAPTPVAAPSPVPVPPSCNWTCSREHGTHGPRCAQYVPPGTMAPTPLAMRIVGEYQSGGDGLRLLLGGEDLTEFQSWAAAQHGLPPEPRPPEPRIRDIYVEGDGADPDYTGTEVR